MRLPSQVRRRTEAAASNPHVHTIGNHNLIHALLLPAVWSAIRYTAFGGVDVRSAALAAVPEQYKLAGAVDLGCSVGHMTRALNVQGPVVGLDASSVMLDVAWGGKFELANVCVDPLPEAGLYSLAFLLHEMPIESQYAVFHNVYASNRSAAVLVLDIDPSVSSERPVTGEEPYLKPYLQNVHHVLTDISRRHRKRLESVQIAPKCRAWILCSPTA